MSEVEMAVEMAAENGEAIPFDPAAPPLPRIMNTHCWTNQAGCQGIAQYKNTGAQAASYTVWRDNGRLGRSNFVLQPGQGQGIDVQTGDTQSAVWGSVVVPDDAPRSYIWVA